MVSGDGKGVTAIKNDPLLYTSLGELIHIRRKQMELSLSELGRLSGVSKGVLSKIETGETKRPEFRTIKPIAEVLSLPYEKIVIHYLEIENRSEPLYDLLLDTIQSENLALIPKIAQKLLESPQEDTYILLERLYKLATVVEKSEIRLLLFGIIIKYSRERGIPQYLVKSLLQHYLIERQDLTRMQDSFLAGQEILHYVDFLSLEDKLTYFYRMALQAFAIKKYNECIKFGKCGHSVDQTSNDLKEQVALAICNSYFLSEDYTALEEHLKLYESMGYGFVIERIKYFRALILSRTGEYDQAIPLLRECLKEVSNYNRLHRVNMLLEALLQINDLDSIRAVIDMEEKKFVISDNEPFQYSELGRYYKYKGLYLVSSGWFDEGVEAFLNSISYYGKVRDYSGILKSTEMVISCHRKYGKMLDNNLLSELEKNYNLINTNIL